MRVAAENEGKVRKKMEFEEVFLWFVYTIILLGTTFTKPGLLGHCSLRHSVVQYLSSHLDYQVCGDRNTFHFVHCCIPQNWHSNLGKLLNLNGPLFPHLYLSSSLCLNFLFRKMGWHLSCVMGWHVAPNGLMPLGSPLPHWLWAGPCDLFCSVRHQQAWCKQRPHQHSHIRAWPLRILPLGTSPPGRKEALATWRETLEAEPPSQTC